MGPFAVAAQQNTDKHRLTQALESNNTDGWELTAYNGDTDFPRDAIDAISVITCNRVWNQGIAAALAGREEEFHDAPNVVEQLDGSQEAVNVHHGWVVFQPTNANSGVEQVASSYAPTLGFTLLAQFRWLTDREVVARMIIMMSCLFVITVLVDGGARRKRLHKSFAAVEFSRTLWWAGFCAGIVVLFFGIMHTLKANGVDIAPTSVVGTSSKPLG